MNTENHHYKNAAQRITLFVVVLMVVAAAFFIIHSYIIDKSKNNCNVILISLDTLRADHMGIYGYNRDTTPHLNEFARKGIVFENTFASSPNTVISHATMLTSLEPMVHEATPEYILGNEFDTLAEFFKKKGYKTGGFTTHGSWLNKKMGFAQGFDDFHSQWANAPGINEYVFEFLEKNKKNDLFLFVHYYDIHSDYKKLPYDTGTYFDRKFCNDYKGAFTGCRDNSCASFYLEKVNSNKLTIPEKDLEYIMALYDGGIAYSDHHVNRLFKRLKELDLFDNSMIVITADHGEEFKEHGCMLHEQLYDEVMHVPFMVKLPGKTEHARIRTPVGVIDIMPTILDFVGIPYEKLQGKSALPFIRGPEKGIRFVYSTLAGVKPNISNTDISLRNLDFSFFTYDKFKKSELYDIKADPGEKFNIADEKKKEKKSLLKKAMKYYQDQRKLKELFKHKRNRSALTKEERERLKSLGYLN